MEILGDITDVPTAGARVQLTTSTRKARAVTIQGHPDNTGNIFVGGSDVSSTTAIKVLEPGDVLEVSFGEKASISADFWYVDAATNGDDAVWGMLII